MTSTDPATQEQHLRDASRQEPQNEIDAVREDIERTREQLGQTVQALAAKADVKTRMQTSVRQDPLPWVSAAAFVIGALILWSARRRSANASFRR